MSDSLKSCFKSNNQFEELPDVVKAILTPQKETLGEISILDIDLDKSVSVGSSQEVQPTLKPTKKRPLPNSKNDECASAAVYQNHKPTV